MKKTDEPAEMVKAFFNQYRELYGDKIGFPRDFFETAGNGNTVGQTPSRLQEALTSETNIRKNHYTETVMPELPALAELRTVVASCEKCALCKTRTQTVFGSGSPTADIMFIGEAPGADEDAQGQPFVGRAGQLLTKMIEEPRSLGIPRSDVYIANILKCRPPNNRKPNAGEIEQCEPYLITQIETVRPKIICALGLTAANTLLRNDLSMTAMREKTFDYHGVPLIVTYHPAALLRNPNWKKPAWDDLLKLKSLLNEQNNNPAQ